MPRLLANEHTILTARQHWLVMVPALLAHAFLLIGGLILLGFVSGRATGSVGSHLRDLVPLLDLIMVVVAVISAFYRYLQWRARHYMLTDQRIVVSRGVVNRLTTSVSLDRVQDTIVHQTLMERLVHCGDVEIESAGRDGTEMMRLIPDPQGFCNALLQAIEAHRQGRPYPGLSTDDGIGGAARPQGFDPFPPGQPRAGFGTGAAGAPPGYPGAPAGGYPPAPGYPAPAPGPGGYPGGPPPVAYPQPDYRTVPAYQPRGRPPADVGQYPQPPYPGPPVDPAQQQGGDQVPRRPGANGFPPTYRPGPNETPSG